tara:strand:- start:42 stop:398 length:357 start_codon:yes stop_codon:yes gene_type:complete
VKIYKEFTFEAAHRLPNVPLGHKCHRMHGHRYVVTLWIEGEVGKTGFVNDFDFAHLNGVWHYVAAQLDHNVLNNVEGLENPTVENIAVWIWNFIELEICAIEVRETATSGCLYEGPKQ